jgi:hypothetical protein
VLRHFRRPGSDWKLFLQAYVLVLSVRTALWILPFAKLYKWTIRFREGRIGDKPLPPAAVYKIVWAVSAAARRVPRATCLTQALATQIMLGRRGHRTTLQLGIMKSEAGKMDAHAWLERDGKVLIGLNETFDQLTRLPTLEGENRMRRL